MDSLLQFYLWSNKLEKKSEIVNLLERIAVALEQIADSKRIQHSPQPELKPDDFESKISSELVSETAPDLNDTCKIRDFLFSRGITIKTIPPKQESDEALDKMAVFIGNKLESVQNVLDVIKKNMRTGRPFSMNLKNKPQQTIAHTTNLCTALYRIAFLTNYHYQKSPAYLLYATPSTSPQALNFYSGQWLERYIKSQVISLLQNRDVRFSYVCNPQISLPNGDDFEMDMVFEIDGEVFWLEAKTGDYQKHIEKYSNMSKIMGLDRSHTFMILADNKVTDDLAIQLSDLFGMTVVRAEKFEELLARNLSENHNEGFSH